MGPFLNPAVLERLVRELVEALFPLPKGGRLLGVTLSNLDTGAPATGRQLPLGF